MAFYLPASNGMPKMSFSLVNSLTVYLFPGAYDFLTDIYSNENIICLLEKVWSSVIHSVYYKIVYKIEQKLLLQTGL